MCLEKVKVINVATKDIVCYKWFKISSEGLLSPYREEIWPQKGMTSRLILDKGHVHRGLHAFSEEESAEWDLKDMSSNTDNTVVKKMIIPKGARYARGVFDGHKAITSNRMVFAENRKKKKK